MASVQNVETLFTQCKNSVDIVDLLTVLGSRSELMGSEKLGFCLSAVIDAKNVDCLNGKESPYPSR